MQDRGQTPSTLRDFIAANPVAIISICLTVVSIIISVLSYKVSKQNYKINEQNNKDLILYTEIGDSIAEDECYISVYAIYYTINSQIAVDYMIMPSFVNSNDKAIQNVNFRIILRFIQGFSFNNHLLLNHDFDTLISWNQDYEAKFSDGKQYSLHLPPYHNYGVFQYKKNLITAYDGVGGYGLIDAMRIPMEELFLEMDFLLTYDKQPHPIRIPYRFFYSSEANQNYFEFRDSMMQICYNDYSYRLKRLNVDRKKNKVLRYN